MTHLSAVHNYHRKSVFSLNLIKSFIEVKLLSWVEKLREVQAEKEERMSGAVINQVTLLGSTSDALEESKQKRVDLEEKTLLDVHQEREGR